MNQDVRAPYYGELGRLSFSPGWARPEPAMWPAPKPKFRPAVWRYAAAKAALDQAGSFVPVEEAERRNLIMVNPIAGNVYATSRNIVAAYQMVKAGERARSHRHTAAALRLVVEAKPGTYTVVDGARIDMAPGDVVLTPSWCWHGHAPRARPWARATTRRSWRSRRACCRRSACISCGCPPACAAISARPRSTISIPSSAAAPASGSRAERTNVSGSVTSSRCRAGTRTRSRPRRMRSCSR